MNQATDTSSMSRRTATIAVVGADGSGKTSVTKAILNSGIAPAKYLYMGPAIGSSNHALPTSRLISYLRKRAVRPMVDNDGDMPPAELQTAQMKQRLHRGPILKTLGLLNRIAEEWYRQLIAWTYKIRGYSTLSDRHYLFEYCPDSPSQQKKDAFLSERIHTWMLSNLYPEPELVLFLDAPAEVLHRRKPEWTLDYLNLQRKRISEQGQATRNFVVIDADQPIETVVAAVAEQIATTIRVRQRLPESQ